MAQSIADLQAEIRACRLCAERFAATHTAHSPRPVVWFGPSPRILIAGQAPGLRVHGSGRPFTDPSGDRLRDWLGIDEEIFYDLARVAVVPAAFCFPGYNAKGSDLPPPTICRRTWHDPVSAALGPVPLKVLVGGYAHKSHLGTSDPVTHVVQNWRAHAPAIFPLPHASWRNNAWIKRNAWFETDLLPALRSQVKSVLGRDG
ncbi:MAG: uracil-DNA glycosylase family protein [Rhodobacteraceae bacterium]|nr:uracil-DNA glycosylase family protein [Paracoccaceae bacterium]